MKSSRTTIRNGKSKHPSKTKMEWYLTRRQIRLGLVAAGTLVIIAGAGAVYYSLPHKLTPDERVMIRHYESVRTALSGDDLATARSAASPLIDSARNNSQIRRSATALREAESLQAARVAFAAISSPIVKLASGNDGYYRIGCSMARCPVQCERCLTIEFGDWIQTSPVVQNPFMGRARPDCGVVK